MKSPKLQIELNDDLNVCRTYYSVRFYTISKRDSEKEIEDNARERSFKDHDLNPIQEALKPLKDTFNEPSDFLSSL